MSSTYIQLTGAAVHQPLFLKAIADSPSNTNVQQLDWDTLILTTLSDFNLAKKSILWLYGYFPGDDKPPPITVNEINEETWNELYKSTKVSLKRP